ncbi:hypothetical protein L6452_30319 [Arctium lappa]|uniref:Uncharacterized protein n=1 Tax=Arctium lappa TaxID=4217 RepID=A0ACB8ZHZ4_ARCLA|nr:hypothetical protein L6452_30319 [Arctium lappa]
MDGEVVPSSLVEIVPILRLANEVEPLNLRVAFLCRSYALNKALRQDPRSSDPGVRKFKSDLHDRLERQQETSIFARERETDALEMQSFYQQYYKKHFQVLQNATDDMADHVHFRKVYRTASVLFNIFEVLKAVCLTGSVEVDREILESHTEIVKKMEIYASYDTLQLEPGSSDQAMLSYPEVKQLDLLIIPLYVIKNGTQDFSERNIIGKGGYGRVYKGILSWADHKNQLVAVKRLDVTGFQGNKEFFSECLQETREERPTIAQVVLQLKQAKEIQLEATVMGTSSDGVEMKVEVVVVTGSEAEVEVAAGNDGGRS